MKKTLFTLLFVLTGIYTYAQDASDFGANDVVIANFETSSPMVTDSLWLDTLKTNPVIVPSANITLAENPFLLENSSATAAKYVRPAGGWRSVYIRFNRSIVLSKTPYLQVQIYPVSGKTPAKSSVSINLINDKGEVVSAGGYMGNIPQDEWSTVSAFLGKQKSSVAYNAIEIMINPDDSLSKIQETEYFIDQIGFKAPADGSELPATVFYETFGTYNQTWQDGKGAGQKKGEEGTADIYASLKGFTSELPWVFKDFAVDTASTFVARTWGMGSKYEGASSNGRIQLRASTVGTLATGMMDVEGFSNLKLSFGLGTQTWWPYNGDIANARPKVEISVNGGAFYEIFSPSEFLKSTGEFVDLGWGPMEKFEDQIFTLVEYPFTTLEGAPLPAVNTIDLHISYKAGTDFWIDDLWMAGNYGPTSLKEAKTSAFSVYPNPATNYILTPNAQKVTISDLNGRVLMHAENTSSVSVSNLAKGIYLVKVTEANSTKTGKLIKE